MLGVDKKAESIVFRTDGKWTVNDLKNFLTSISKIYEITFKASISEERQISFIVSYLHRKDNFLNDYKTNSAGFKKSLINTKSFEKEMILDSLRIYHIKMGSLGYISFEGIGEVIKELREIIKDLVFRNKQEKTMGELKICEYRLKLMDKYGYLIFRQKKSVIREIKKIKALQKQNKIIDINENIDF